MKKLLAMVLALVMTLSLAVSANAAFKDDKSISDDYAESVAVLNGMGVFKGYEDGSFKPEGNITRAEVATIIYRIYTADVAKNDKSGLYATYNKFSDMAGAGWAQGYIGYCATRTTSSPALTGRSMLRRPRSSSAFWTTWRRPPT